MIYLIKSGKYSKVGYAKDIERRKLDYNTHNPEYTIILTREGERDVETELHRLLKRYIDHGEWMIHNEDIEKTFKTYVSINERLKEQEERELKFKWIYDTLIKQYKDDFTYEELETLFVPIFKEHGMIWNKNTTIKTFFPPFSKKQRMLNKKRYTYYHFKL